MGITTISNNQKIIVKEGNPLIVATPFRKEGLWHVSHINPMNGYKVSVTSQWHGSDNRNEQRFAITIIAEKPFALLHVNTYVGAILFANPSSKETYIVSLELSPLSVSKIETQTTRSFESVLDGIITLRNPCGASQIAIKAGQKLEIVIKGLAAPPQIDINLRSGRAVVQDNSNWILEDEKYQRILLAFIGTSIGGTIKIGEASIEISDIYLPTMVMQRLKSVVTFQSESDIFYCENNNEDIVLDAMRPATIKIKSIDRFISPHLTSKATIFFNQFTLPKHCTDRLSKDMEGHISPYQPWEDLSPVVTHSTAPWDTIAINLPSISSRQWYYSEVIKSFNTRDKIIPVGVIECCFDVSGLFQILKKINVSVKNDTVIDSIMKKDSFEQNVYDPEDKSKIHLGESKLLCIYVKPKIENNKKIFWKLSSAPLSVIFLGTHGNTNSSYQKFAFYVKDSKVKSTIGKLMFTTRSLSKEIELVII